MGVMGGGALLFSSEADQPRKWPLLREEAANPKTEPSRLVTGEKASSVKPGR